MGFKTGAATARVLSEMYREKKVGEDAGPIAPSRAPSSERTEEARDRRVSEEPVRRGSREC